jgi:hypothetical protein
MSDLSNVIYVKEIWAKEKDAEPTFRASLRERIWGKVTFRRVTLIEI